jgi:NAD(P)H dehydrogenase (quinone)
MLIITGGNGHLGRATIGYLLQKGAHPAALRVSVRDVSKATHLQKEGIPVVGASYDDVESMIKAFRGGNTLLLISGDAPVQIRTAQAGGRCSKESGYPAHCIYLCG